MVRGLHQSVATLAITTTVGYGVLFYAYGVLLVPMEDDLGWSRSFLTGVFSVALLVSAALTIVVGRWLDRHPPQPLFIGGAVTAAVLSVGWSTSTSKLGFAAVWVLLGCCQAVLFYEPAFTVLTKWFGGLERHRSVTAVTLLAGLASTLFGPLTSALERAYGWRTAVLLLGGLLAVTTIPLFATRLRAPAAELLPVDVAVASPPRAVINTRRFRLLTAAYLLNAITTFAVGVHLVAYLRDHDVNAGAAASVLGAVGLVQVLGRSTFTRLSAVHSAIRVGTAAMIAKAAGLAVLVLVPGWLGIGAFVALYGSANGIATLTRAMTVAELYGATYYGTISATVAAVSAVGGAVAPFAAAAAMDLVGNDEPVFAGMAVLTLVGAAVNALVSDGPHRDHEEEHAGAGGRDRDGREIGERRGGALGMAAATALGQRDDDPHRQTEGDDEGAEHGMGRDPGPG